MTSKLKVELVDKMGTDLSVVNAARVSYAKFKDSFEDKDEKLIKFLAEKKQGEAREKNIVKTIKPKNVPWVPLKTLFVKLIIFSILFNPH